MNRPWLVLFLYLTLFVTGCSVFEPPLRRTDLSTSREAVAAYHDYLRLERFGVPTVRLQEDGQINEVALPVYLFALGEVFERLGRPQDAVKLYLRLLVNHPVLNGDDQLGVRTENRLRWVLGDKQWVKADLADLVRRLSAALAAQDVEALRQLMSRDFGLGWSEQNRLALDYQDGLNFLASHFRGSGGVHVDEITPVDPAERVNLRTSGWGGEHPVWVLSLRHRARPSGWEWDLAYWDEPRD